MKNTLGEIIIYELEDTPRIIVNNQIINNATLKWNKEGCGQGFLTLDGIAKQINTVDVIYVWCELGLSGKIYIYNNYDDEKWYLHGTTRGYA
ncbi:hypothetical protein [Paenisporosarcina cavernae]|uniref:Uncharacterized protein n=1 Tax=Paenisporosarcina cavernae TaxID=2320858 RepID=A0A385YUQ8_9BACL|nr:hypothetical protein [Paenisporosarcina cavernae]AYC29657.1 hypothetical protein D3873_07050 [Paenisporosarcina cavernae]